MLKRIRSTVIERKVKEGKGLDLAGMCTEMEFWSFWMVLIYILVFLHCISQY